jgi:transglutaminase/protease-like cytokinesis protein 3
MNRRRGSTARKELTMNNESITETSGAAGQTTPKRKRAGKGKPAKQTAKAKTRTKKAKLAKSKSTSKSREGSKTAMVLELLRRKEGATTAEIAKATQWQDHSIRGFISGTVTKKMGLTVESTKNGAGERTYRIGE